MGGRSITLEFSITGLSTDGQTEIMRMIYAQLSAGVKLLDIPVSMDLGDDVGDDYPTMSCVVKPSPDGKLIPSAVVTVKDPSCSAVVIEADAERVLVESLESADDADLKKGERVRVDREKVTGDGSYLVFNRPIEDDDPYRAIRRRRRGVFRDPDEKQRLKI